MFFKVKTIPYCSVYDTHLHHLIILKRQWRAIRDMNPLPLFLQNWWDSSGRLRDDGVLKPATGSNVHEYTRGHVQTSLGR